MKPTHHIPGETLADYAAGNTPEAVSLVVACHVTLCAACQAELARLETLAGVLLETAQVQPLDEGALEKVMMRLDPAAASPVPALPVPITRRPSEGNLPRPLLRYLPGDNDLPWKFLAPGVRSIELNLGPRGSSARLVKLKPGMVVPLHDHEGAEHTLIFTGGLQDPSGHYLRGDVAIRQSGERHEQRVDDGEPCIALVLNEGSLVPLTWRGRLLDFITST